MTKIVEQQTLSNFPKVWKQMESEVNRNFKQGIVSIPVWFRIHVSRTWVFSHAFQDPQELNSDNRRASDGVWLRVSATKGAVTPSENVPS